MHYIFMAIQLRIYKFAKSFEIEDVTIEVYRSTNGISLQWHQSSALFALCERFHRWPSLKRKCIHFDEIFIAGCSESCQYENCQCSQWWKFRQNDDIFSYAENVSMLRYHHVVRRLTASGTSQSGILTHLPLDKMASISQTTFSNAFSWMINLILRFKFHWSLFLRVQLIITQHWFR